jgi:hypothetical protein
MKPRSLLNEYGPTALKYGPEAFAILAVLFTALAVESNSVMEVTEAIVSAGVAAGWSTILARAATTERQKTRNPP